MVFLKTNQKINLKLFVTSSDYSENSDSMEVDTVKKPRKKAANPPFVYNQATPYFVGVEKDKFNII